MAEARKKHTPVTSWQQRLPSAQSVCPAPPLWRPPRQQVRRDAEGKDPCIIVPLPHGLSCQSPAIPPTPTPVILLAASKPNSRVVAAPRRPPTAGGRQKYRRNAGPQRSHRCPRPFGHGDHRCHGSEFLVIVFRHFGPPCSQRLHGLFANLTRRHGQT